MKDQGGNRVYAWSSITEAADHAPPVRTPEGVGGIED